MSVDVRIVEAQALRVGPDECLLISLPHEVEREFIPELMAALDRMGLGDRAIVLVGADAEFAVVPRSSSDGAST